MKSVNETSGFFARNRSTFVLGLTALIIAAIADLFAGIFLKEMEEFLMIVPGMLILIYTAIGMRGNIYGAMGSRMGTSMHMGTFSMNLKKGSVLRKNIEATLALTMIMSVTMGFAGWVIVELLFGGGIGVLEFTFISAAGGLLAGIVVMGFNIMIAFEGFKHNWDVDNITAPLIAAVGDIVTVPMIFLSTWIFISLDSWIIQILCIILILFTIAVSYVIIRRKNKKRRGMDEAKRIVVQSTPVLIMCLILEICAGMLIQQQEDKFYEFAVLLILLPAFLNEGNALSGMLTSRLSSMIHLGTLKTNKLPPKEAYENFGIMYLLAILTFAFIGVAAYLVAPASLSFLTTMTIVLLAGILTTTVINYLSYYVAVLAVRLNLNPDDHCIPITSSIMDAVGSVILMCVIFLVI